MPADGRGSSSALSAKPDRRGRAGLHDLRARRNISPRQMKAGSNLFERLVMEPNLRLKAVLDEAGCDLIFHDCGELIDDMVEAFANRLHPRILSLGSSRKLWDPSFQDEFANSMSFPGPSTA